MPGRRFISQVVVNDEVFRYATPTHAAIRREAVDRLVVQAVEQIGRDVGWLGRLSEDQDPMHQRWVLRLVIELEDERSDDLPDTFEWANRDRPHWTG